MRRVARIVHVERHLLRRSHGHRFRNHLKALGWVLRVPVFVAKEIASVVQHNVLDQVHAPAMQGIREQLVVFQTTHVRIDSFEVRGPIAVIAAVDPVPPLIGHGGCDPHRSGAQTLDVVQPFSNTRQIATAVVRFFVWIEFAGALIVVTGVAILKSIGHEEVHDLISPIGRGHMQLQIRTCIGCCQCHPTKGQGG